MSSNYITEQKERILRTFNDSPVVLVEVFSKLPEFRGQICAITENTGGYLPLDVIILQGCFEKDNAATFGITTKCIELMEQFEKPQENKEQETVPMTTSILFWCLLVVFALIFVQILMRLFL